MTRRFCRERTGLPGRGQSVRRKRAPVQQTPVIDQTGWLGPDGEKSRPTELIVPLPQGGSVWWRWRNRFFGRMEGENKRRFYGLNHGGTLGMF